MPNSRIHGILSAVHGLLSNYKESELQEAARYPGVSKAIKTALLSLASESSGRFRTELDGGSKEQLRRSREGRLSSASSIAPGDVFIAIRSSPYFESTVSIVEFAKGMGIKIQRAPKESKERLAKKLARAISLLPEGRQSQIMRELSMGRSAQTQGWIDVIKTRQGE